MTPVFLPHTALDVIDELGAALLTETERQGRKRLQALRDRAIESGVSVIVLLWPSMHWTLLAVEPPPDVTITDPAQLIPNLMANTEALEQMHAHAQQGKHLVWLSLTRPVPALH